MTDYLLHLADNALILGHRNSEWTAHGPILEQDIALSNIALDLVGQARNLYQYAAKKMGNGATEDTLAYLRDARQFKNFLLVEQDNGDWGKTILRQFLFSAYQFPLYRLLQGCGDKELAAIAEKSLKEVTYHLRWSSEWVIRLGQGTEESMNRMKAAVQQLWKFTGELTSVPLYADNHSEIYHSVAQEWHANVVRLFSEAGLDIPHGIIMISGGIEGDHTEHLDSLLQEMQYLQRAYPGAAW